MMRGFFYEKICLHFCPLDGVQRQHKPEAGTLQISALHKDAFLVRFQNMFNDSKSQTRAAIMPVAAGFHPEKPFEDATYRFRFHAHAIVFHFYQSFIAHNFRVQGDRREIPVGIIDGVGHQVDQHLRNFLLICGNEQRTCRNFQLEPGILALRLQVEQICNLAQQGIDIKRADG